MFSAKRFAPLALLVLAAASVAPAQTVRFQTSVGAFDMLLNPTNNANLQPLVDNMLANVAAGVYRKSVVNRAVEDFVLQIGSFTSDSRQLSETPQFGFDGTNSFDPVVVDANNDGQVDFDTSALTNTRGTISLALSSAGPNSGSASFFVNLTDNSFLDDQGFVPFAEIADMTVIDRIMGLEKIDLSAAVGQQGSLAYTDVPLASDGDLVLIETATVISENNTLFVGPLRNAFGLDDLPMAGDSTSGASSFSSSSSLDPFSASNMAAGSGSSIAVPEPTALFLAMIGLAAATRR
ncbi:peptidylprolyl isomerase [Botrimarina mediterranea]|uniref:Peptidyl-prolyl cis-trans isomerase B n=1 Tax=Botrimarina mediterranea TaxID=2528022 RepID=A0A518K6D6_9BACT|nr:peptidylprolyl isomerase [Botrimarina mediterranea]QDV73356.1 Peptidyl-prolyl cis-trans isomerase B [Botrimarina mediterranea]QDV77873.1 Peptidyl-prolyl cis-trans isomerase B [Planctomycetes bacterium K2D]